MDILEEVRRRLENEIRQPAELFGYLQSEGWKMFTTRRVSQEQVIGCCVALIAMYEKIKEG